jgi:hypothetical protein
MIENWIGKLIDWWYSVNIRRLLPGYARLEKNLEDMEIDRDFWREDFEQAVVEIASLNDKLHWKGKCHDELLVQNGGLRARNGNLCRTIRNFEGLITENAKLEDAIRGLSAERDFLRCEHADLIQLCENLLKAYDEHQKPFGGVGSILALAIECIRDHVNPNDSIRNKDS